MSHLKSRLLPNAVEMEYDYAFDVNSTDIPVRIRQQIPPEFVSTEASDRGMTRLMKGELGWRTQVSPNGQWSVCQFKRGHGVVVFMVPTSYLRIGAKVSTNLLDQYMDTTTTPYTVVIHGDTAGRSCFRQIIPETPHQPEMYRYSSEFLFPTIWEDKNHRFAQLALAPNFNFTINQQTIDGGNIQAGKLCNLVIEVTVDKVRHPRPYIIVPDIGVYEDFGQGSCMSISIESYDEDTKKWYCTRIFHRHPLSAVEAGNYTPLPWLQVKRILQLLEGTRYATTTPHFKDQSFSVESMQHLNYNQLAQTVGFTTIPHPEFHYTPLPRLMTMEDNAALMAQKYPFLAIGSGAAPSFKDQSIKCPDNSDQSKNLTMCDFCWWLTQISASKLECVGDSGECESCTQLLRRPCTWTDRPMLLKWQDLDDPHHLWFGQMEGHVTREEIFQPLGTLAMIKSLAARVNDSDARDKSTVV
ncbi:hypothetical protein PFICI_09987 [Pestalotiopsis fici W106-1]|uniref:Uncharacterized protein n=1 Tax=Pestalotiopsis fici (strain W106-1 / CGMCC3.15140) TaxID=1229662 RepID=W3WVP8_PESFW|nr:uncharacterized protein PFICI_09987 [Pestalotiopsis fici W106-1]ETS77925.1 hypothetical protein PFICI_09987 [Pestalotiopsis fici W106-1]